MGTRPAFPARSALVALVSVIAATALAAGCSSAKPDLPKSPQARHDMRLQGAVLFDSLIAAHGGMEAWGKVTEMTFRGSDEWTGPWARILNPWPTERAAGQHNLRVHETRGRIAIVTDRGTLVYGYGNTGPWALLRGEPSPEPKDEQSATYLVQWHAFQAGLPFVFKEHGAVAHYLGRKHSRYQNALREFDEVLLTFPPEGNYWPEDWFVVRMDPNTHQMRTITYTTTGKAPKLFETTCEFSEFVEIEGLRIPTRRTCRVTQPVEADLHTWTLADLRFNQVSPDDFFERKGTLPVATPASPDTTPPAARPAPGEGVVGGPMESTKVEATARPQ